MSNEHEFVRLSRLIDIPEPALSQEIALSREGAICASTWLGDTADSNELNYSTLYAKLRTQAGLIESPLLRSNLVFLLDVLILDQEEQDADATSR